MNILLLVILTMLPGAWITFGLPLAQFDGKVRLALGVALSPAILAIQFLALKFLGMDFDRIAIFLLVLNVPAGILLLRQVQRPHELRLSRTSIFASLLFLLLAGALVLPWLLIPGYRLFSWHSLVHTDVIYEITRFRLLPEEPELAGLVLIYDWAGEIYWSVLGWLANWAPTSIYPITNLIWLLVTFVLAYELAQTGLGLQPSTALFGVGLLFLASQVIGVGTWLVINDKDRWTWILGNVNNTAVLNKYQGFEDMPFGLALLPGLALVCLFGLQRHVRWLGVISASLMIAIGILYPLLFSMACILVASTIFLLVSKLTKGIPNYTPIELLLLIGGFILSVVVVLAFIANITRDRAVSPFQFFPPGKISRSLIALTTLLPLALLAAPFVIKSLRRLHGPVLLLSATGFCLAALYVFAKLSDAGEVETTFLYAAAIALAPLSAGGVDPLLTKWKRASWYLVVIIPLILVILNFQYMFHLGAGIPTNLVYSPQVNEQSFWITLATSEPDRAWTDAVRESTPTDTIVVALESDIHLEPFVARSLYFPSDWAPTKSDYTVSPAGYSADKRIFLTRTRGYSKKIWDERFNVINSLYSETNPTKLASLLASLKQLNRPLVVHFSSETVPALIWLRREKIGAELFSDNTNIVWLIERQNVPMGSQHTAEPPAR